MYVHIKKMQPSLPYSGIRFRGTYPGRKVLVVCGNGFLTPPFSVIRIFPASFTRIQGLRASQFKLRLWGGGEKLSGPRFIGTTDANAVS